MTGERERGERGGSAQSLWIGHNLIFNTIKWEMSATITVWGFSMYTADRGLFMSATPSNGAFSPPSHYYLSNLHAFFHISAQISSYRLFFLASWHNQFLLPYQLKSWQCLTHSTKWFDGHFISMIGTNIHLGLCSLLCPDLQQLPDLNEPFIVDQWVCSNMHACSESNDTILIEGGKGDTQTWIIGQGRDWYWIVQSRGMPSATSKWEKARKGFSPEPLREQSLSVVSHRFLNIDPVESYEEINTFLCFSHWIPGTLW